MVGEQRGTQQIFSIDVATGNLEQQTQGPHDLHTLQVLPDGRILATQQSMVRPVELALIDPADGKIETVTAVNGEVKMEINDVLEDDDLAEGLILGCQARPVSDSIEVSYD